MTRVLWIFLLLTASGAYAEPWLCTLPDGRKEFSYEPESASNKRCVNMPMSRGYVRATPSGSTEGSSDFPRVDRKTQKQRDAARRDILERELAEEKSALARTVAELEQVKRSRVEAPIVLRQYEERIRTHRTNIANIEKELGLAG
jgi:hypothetical protein